VVTDHLESCDSIQHVVWSLNICSLPPTKRGTAHGFHTKPEQECISSLNHRYLPKRHIRITEKAHLITAKCTANASFKEVEGSPDVQ